MGYIERSELIDPAQSMSKTDYGQYLLDISNESMQSTWNLAGVL